jgi:hypothetical protein
MLENREGQLDIGDAHGKELTHNELWSHIEREVDPLHNLVKFRLERNFVL